MKTTSKILQFFCYDYFEDLLASVTFANNPKIFAIKNALQSKNQFLRDAFGKSYLLRHLIITIAHKYLILEIGYAYYAHSVFLPKSTFYKFFSKEAAKDQRKMCRIENSKSLAPPSPSVYGDSVIGQHLLENEECGKHYNDAQFSMLATARVLFHLIGLETTYINSLQPILCRLKKICLFSPNFTIISCAHFGQKPNNIFRPIK